MKKVFVLFAIGSFLLACTPKQEKAVEVTTTEFETVAPEMLGQLIQIEGTVNHVCKHGGKKMFIGGENVKIIVSETIAAFDPVLEGSEVIITGYVREEMNEAVLAETEGKHAEETEGEHVEAEGTEEVEAEHQDSVGGEEVAAEDCDMEKVKPLYIIEVKTVTEKKAETEEK